MVLKSIIVEDEPLARLRLASLLREHGGVDVIATFDSARAAIAAIDDLDADVAFVDIELADGNGLEVAETVRERTRPYVVFTTAFSEYAVQAFEARALDYLLKPVEFERRREALQRVSSSLTPSLRQQPPPAARERIALRQGERSVLIRTRDMDWLKSVGNYVEIHVGGAVYAQRIPLYEFERDLDPAMFVRIERGTIVNVTRIREISRGVKSGEYIALLHDGSHLRVKRRYADALRRVVGNF